MKGWMKYQQKGGIVGRIASLRLEYHYLFVLTNDCSLLGYKDETALASDKPDVVFDVHDSAITISQETSNQFELIFDKNHLVFTVDVASDTIKWISSIQNQRSINQGVSPAPKQFHQRKITHSSPSTMDNHSKNFNGNHVFDDPLNVASSGINQDFEWDSEAASTILTEGSPVSPASYDQPSAVFQLSQELTDAKRELTNCRQRILSYQEVLESRDRQLFELRDEMAAQNSHEISGDAFKNMEEQVRSYRDQNALLNEEVLKLHQMYNKSHQEAVNQKRRADKLEAELKKYQRGYVAALSHCVHRPLVDPDDGARFTVSEHDQHIAMLKALTRSMKSTNDRILGCSIPAIGKTEHVDMFGFIHSLPNEALQVQYLCCHLKDAYDVLMETEEDNQKNLKKWKSYILDSSEQFELTPHLRKLIRNGIPNQYRAYVWQKLIFYYVADLRGNYGESYYEAILSQQEILLDDKTFMKNLKQITMDVPRTMPHNRDFTATDSPHRERLHHVLTAFCVHSPNIAYCQGFNFLAGGCLLFLEEEEAFWFLVAVTEKLFPPDYYQNGLSGLLADQYVLQQIITQTLPKLNDHLMKFPEVDLAAVTTGWFLGLFFDCLPFQTLIRVWDCFLSFGHEAIFRVACAIFKIFESKLIELNELSQILHALKNIPRLCIYPALLIKEAFSGPFPAWEEIEEQRNQLEIELIEKHERKMQQRRYYDQRIMMFDQLDEYISHHDNLYEKWVFDYGAVADKCILSANCKLTQNSQLFEVDTDFVKPLGLPITNRVMCVYVITDDVILVGLFSGQLQAYSKSESSLLWSMSLSDIVLCILSFDDTICVGTADGKLHLLGVSESGDKTCSKKPLLRDSVELSKQPTTCFCYIADQCCLWVASGPAIYVVSTETNETDGFFLISSRIVMVSFMLHWSTYVLIGTKNSSVVQLHSTDNFSTPPLLVYDLGKDVHLPLLYPMIPDETESGSRSGVRITSLTLVSDDVFWVGTATGEIKMYQLESKDGKDDAQSNSASASPEEPEDLGSLSLRLTNSKNASDKPIRCLLKNESQVLSCCGCYGDEDSVKIWTFDGDFTSLEFPISESSSSDILDGSRSPESSSRSLDADAKQHRGDAAAGESWKSAMRSVAANAMKTYRDKKPRIGKFMKMLGTYQN